VGSFLSPVRPLLFAFNRFAARQRPGLRVLALWSTALVCVASPDAFVQTSAQTPAPRPAQTPAPSPAQNAASAQISAFASTVDAVRVVQFLDQTIAWYHQLGAQQQLVSDANDAVYVSTDRQMADEVVRLAFQFARAQESAQPTAASAQPLSGQAASGQGAAPTPSQTLVQQEAEAQTDENQVVGEVVDLQKRMAAASGPQKQALAAQLAETQAEVDLAKARVDAIQKMSRFLSGVSTGATGLGAQIDALESTLPPDLREATRGAGAKASPGGGPGAPSSQPPVAPASPPAAMASVAADSGLWESAASLFSTWGKLRSITTAVQQTQELARSAKDIRDPQVADLRALTARGDELAHLADTASTATLEQERQQLDAVTLQFTQLTGSAIPLAQAGILLGLYQKNLASWHASVVTEFETQSWGLAARLMLLGVLVALALGASALWRRAIYKYVRDPRRRWQLHWVRKFVVGGAIATILTFSLVSQIGSIATFAGLISAGVAVSLQNVIQSIVGYFFLIGKYGIRAGDRVMIGGVSGEVIDVGLVRIHLMEMGGTGAHTPTGRVVAFSNSIVFQATPGLFKQIPGTSFGWHEITLTLPADIDFSAARERLMKAVEAGLADFKDEITKQHAAIEDALEGSPGAGLQPTVQLQFTSSGLEALVRYPVSLRQAMEIDERITHAILADFDRTPGARPAIRLKTETSA